MQSYQRLQTVFDAPTWWALQLTLGPSQPHATVGKALVCLSVVQHQCGPTSSDQ